MDVYRAIQQLRSGAITFDELKAQFEAATFTVRQPTRGDWGAVYQRAEEGPDDTDAPSQLYAAESAGIITQAQQDELFAIYRRRLGGGGDEPEPGR
ncbi:hypothetical protein [Mycolicibacterium setense]